MKTSIQSAKVPVIITLLFICAIGFSQKSINYQSVGTHLEEISIFFEESCQSIKKTSGNDILFKIHTSSQTNSMIKLNHCNMAVFYKANCIVYKPKEETPANL